jgi:hypothetical protein
VAESVCEIITSGLGEHPAVRAWREIRGDGAEPEAIEVIGWRLRRADKNKSLVCRLVGLDSARSNVIGKRCRTATAQHEHLIYREILPQLPISSLRCHGLVTEPGGKHSWLFLEDAGGEPFSSENGDHRVLAAQWLGLMHVSARDLEAAARLPDRGPGHYLWHLHSGSDLIRRHLDNPSLGAEDIEVLETILSYCDTIASHWGPLEQACDGLPRTLVHGDFVPKNVRVRSDDGARSLAILDWETSGYGIPAPDLLRLDIPAYCSSVRTAWPHLDLPAVRRLARLGRLFRGLAAVHWESTSLAYPWLEQPMARMTKYASRLADSLREAGWKT